MAYIKNGVVIEGKQVNPTSFIWSFINAVALFFQTLFSFESTSAQVEGYKKKGGGGFGGAGGGGGGGGRGPNIHGVPKPSQSSGARAGG